MDRVHDDVLMWVYVVVEVRYWVSLYILIFFVSRQIRRGSGVVGSRDCDSDGE